ncbi:MULTISPECIES: flagellar hook-length control protein FliK [unclassified Vibrio]|uniref:flagellar hook-length control protein FliK n=1 Tax=unclassified Vibrio TaxID=2614977 RepID=UPI001EF15631|nr:MULTISPECIES: flagellar hook-length control protein FliK [unclassified Vibrio]
MIAISSPSSAVSSQDLDTPKIGKNTSEPSLSGSMPAFGQYLRQSNTGSSTDELKFEDSQYQIAIDDLHLTDATQLPEAPFAQSIPLPTLSTGGALPAKEAPEQGSIAPFGQLIPLPTLSTGGALPTQEIPEQGYSSFWQRIAHDPLNTHENESTRLPPMMASLSTETKFTPLVPMEATQPLSPELWSAQTSHIIKSVQTENQSSLSAMGNLPSPLIAPMVNHAGPAINTPVTTLPASGSQWASIQIDTQAGKWGEQMLQVLHDRVTLQAQQHMQEAKIRLDPPELGKLELLVRVDGDKLNVQINANSTATREALTQISERLRAELQQQNFVHVEVNIGTGQGGGQPNHYPSQKEENTPIFAARVSANEAHSAMDTNSEHWLNTQA